MQNNTSTAERPLTFSVKIEFLVAYLAHGAKDPHEHDNRQIHGILPTGTPWSVLGQGQGRKASKCLAETLNAANIPASCKPEPRSSSRSSEGEPRLSDWILRDKTTVTELIESSNLPYEFATVEITSPTFYFTPEAISQVQAVCEVLTNNYRTTSSKGGGLQVHIGNAANEFPGAAVQKILAALWTLEPVIETMHPRHRIQNEFCRGLRSDSNLLRGFERPGMTWMKVLEKVLGLSNSMSDPVLLETVLALSDNEDGRGAFDFRNLDPKAAKRMIEFRMHESTLDGQAVENWLKVCIGLVNMERVDLQILAPLLVLTIDDVLDVPKTLRILGHPSQALYYYANPQPPAEMDLVYQEVHKNEMLIATPTQPNIKAVEVWGCTCWFIWTSNPDLLIVVQAKPDPEFYDPLFKRSVEAAKDAGKVIAIKIFCEDEEEEVAKENVENRAAGKEEVKEEFEKMTAKFKEVFPDIEPKADEYPQLEDMWKAFQENQEEDTTGMETPNSIDWSFEGTIGTPGVLLWRYVLEGDEGDTVTTWRGEWESVD